MSSVGISAAETYEAGLMSPQARKREAGNRQPARPRNISRVEQWGSVAAGAALLGACLSSRKGGWLLGALGAGLVYRGVTGHCFGYELLGIDTAEHPPATAVPAQQGVKVEKSLTVHRSPEELYRFWRKLENLPHVMQHLEEVTELDGRLSRWTAEGPLGMKVSWDAEIIEERENELIAWRSVPDSSLETAGSVRFKALAGDRGTSVTVSMKYNPPGGKMADAVASLLGSGLKQQLDQDIRRFKSVLEAGEAPTTAGQPSGYAGT